MRKTKKKAAKKAQAPKKKAQKPKVTSKKPVKKATKKSSAAKQTTQEVFVSSGGEGGDGYPGSDSHEDANDVGGLASYDEIDPGFSG